MRIWIYVFVGSYSWGSKVTLNVANFLRDFVVMAFWLEPKMVKNGLLYQSSWSGELLLVNVVSIESMWMLDFFFQYI